ncbi:TOM core complex subunit Tom6 [Sporothrix brasiliensis 5110]|nr:TOM core complex subunit Tom6 [Sporothrix brasiliensis 5110]KIH86886.1 TOM core complex subunit Tom6 [Sporothrix brasiliensis 5110]
MYQPRQIVQVEKAGGQTLQPKGFFRSTYDSLTAAENASFVKGIAAFAVGTAFLASSWGEFLLPP